MRIGLAILLTVVGLSGVAPAAGNRLGQFEAQADVGAPKIAGDAVYDATAQSYRLAAGGANMFHDHDEFHFVWLKVTGNFRVSARMRFVGKGVDPHRKAGLMARGSLAAGAAYVDAVIHGSGPTALQTRRSDGAETEMMVTAGATEASPKATGGATLDSDFLQLERRDDSYTVTIARWGQQTTQQHIADISLGRDLYVGLFLCAHSADAKEEAVVSDVQIERPPTAQR